MVDKEPVTAAVLVIGDEILSGRTKDSNSGYIAEFLTQRGIDLNEIRVVSDDTADIIDAVKALSGRYTYVFTTGGIGPTHDDITADAVAAAFDVGIDHNDEAIAIMKANRPDMELNEARLRMARIPFGASLIKNAVGAPPGFKLENVHVMAGVPSVMKAMLEEVGPTLKGGIVIQSRTLPFMGGEGVIASGLGEIQDGYPLISIGSYPALKDGKFMTNIVLRGRDEALLEEATGAVNALIEELLRK